MPNVDDDIPRNTEGQDIPVAHRYLGAGVPIFWGDNQLISPDTLEYTTPSGMTENAVLHIPKVVRFLYGYDAITEPVENEWVGCGCPASGVCATTICEWELTYFEQMGYGMRLTGDIYPVEGTYTVALQGNTWFVPYYTFAYIAAHTFRIYDNDLNLLYEGNPIDCPPHLVTGYYLYRLRRTRRCYEKNEDGSPDYSQPKDLDGCPETYDGLYVSQDDTPEPLCEREVSIVTGFNAPVSGGYYNARDTQMVIPFSEFPPYDTACTPGPGPC